MKAKNILKTTVVFFTLSILILIAGCQSPGKIIASEKSEICPECKIQTVTTPIKGLTYKRHVCPACKKVDTHESEISAALASYTSMDIETVHVCPHCKSIVEPCPDCCAKM